MGKTGIDWDSTETWQRLVASIIASGVKLDLRQVAKLYGTTYDTLENRLRKVKSTAKELKEEVESGQRGEAAPIRTKSATSTPRKPKTPSKDFGALDTVANGRVAKSTPSKKKSIKQENFENGVSFLSSSYTDDAHSSFDQNPMSFDIGAYDHSFGHSSMLGVEDGFGL